MIALCLSIGVKISGLLTLIKLSSDTYLFRGVGQENALGQLLSPSGEQREFLTLVAQVSQFPFTDTLGDFSILSSLRTMILQSC